MLLLLLLMLLLLLLLGHRCLRDGHSGLILLKGCVRRDLMTGAVHRSGHRCWNDLVELLVLSLDSGRSDLLHQVSSHRVGSVRDWYGWRCGGVRPWRGRRNWRSALIQRDHLRRGCSCRCAPGNKDPRVGVENELLRVGVESGLFNRGRSSW